MFRIGPGPFVTATSVQTAVTKPALAELVKEIRDITGPRPPTDAEMAFAKDRLVKGFPAHFETTFDLARQLEDLVLYKLPGDYFTTYQANIEAVTKSDVARVAKRHLDPDGLLIVVVGDRAKIEEGLKELPFGKNLKLYDTEGDPVQPKTEGGAASP